MLFILALALPPLGAADGPYFVTYTHRLEEPGSLEVAFSHVLAKPQGGDRFVNTLMEIEYGVNGWWTSELYLSGQSTSGQSTVFTGHRWENRFRPLLREHWINPVLYVEFSDVNGADRSLKEIVGFDGKEDLLEPNAEARLEKKRELETKLILSSNAKGWNLSENLIAEKNLNGGAWEFGYAIGISRPLALAASPRPCRFCPENFRAGVELYGGLGTRHEFALRDTSHYIAPGVAWQPGGGVTVRVSPVFGVTQNSNRFLLRFGVAYEVSQFGRLFRRRSS
ncbi:MAG: hypothetical protein HY238_05395 [Acidobacteria bacterium]|nr:hypothetical protein [Acidobacteriota bacterium]